MFCLPIGETNGNFFFPFFFSFCFRRHSRNFVILQLLFTRRRISGIHPVHTWFLHGLGQACTAGEYTHSRSEYIALVLSRMHDARSLWRTGSQQSRHKLFNNRSGPMSLRNRCCPEISNSKSTRKDHSYNYWGARYTIRLICLFPATIIARRTTVCCHVDTRIYAPIYSLIKM